MNDSVDNDTDKEHDKNLSLKERLYSTIFGHDTPEGRLFDIALIYIILISVLAVTILTPVTRMGLSVSRHPLVSVVGATILPPGT